MSVLRFSLRNSVVLFVSVVNTSNFTTEDTEEHRVAQRNARRYLCKRKVPTMLVLGIETSCDETAAAIVRDGREIVSSVIASHIATHKRFGGVVPELASREHLDKIVPIVEEAFSRAQVGMRDIDGIAV